MLSILTAITMATQLAVATPAIPELRREELMSALRAGGYTILVRHARTDRSIPTEERPGYSPPLRADQRNLTADGEADVRLMSKVVQAFALPIGAVYSSPAYRCRETADAFGPATVTMALRDFPVTEEAAALVGAVPEPGTNRIISTHHFVIEALVPGIRPGDVEESGAAVVRPLGDGTVELVGRITLSDWQALADAQGSVAATGSRPEAQAQGARHGVPETTTAVTIPATRAGRIAARYVEAFNSGDGEQMRAFIESALKAAPDRPTQARVQAYEELFGHNGALTVTGIKSSAEDGIEVTFQSKRGEGFLRVSAEPAPSARATVTLGMPGHHR